MPCFKPIKAFKCSDGSVVWTQLKRYDIIGDIRLPCGQCIGCRLDKSRDWAVRCLHEAKMHRQNAFATLTYNEQNLPNNGSLDYGTFQLFMKRLRKEVGPVRFFMCGEYGELTNRPHYHALLFGYWPEDSYYWMKGAQGYNVYRSDSLEKIWGLGNVMLGNVTRESAGYCARYCLKKVTGDRAESHYGGRTPEFAHMSLKPGIGASFFKKFESDILPNDYVVEGGWKIPVPKYYEKLYKGEDLEDIKYKREKYSEKFKENNSDERLIVREEVTKAKIRNLQRSLD